MVRGKLGDSRGGVSLSHMLLDRMPGEVDPIWSLSTTNLQGENIAEVF